MAGAVERLGFEPVISADPTTLDGCRKLILPGVGAFGDGMENLRDRGLIAPLTRMVMEDEKPILGICLGAHLVARTSTEFGFHTGLGWIDAEAMRLEPADPSLRIPHVGWNDLVKVKASPLFEDVPEGALFYYVHSYRLAVEDDGLIVGECDYGGRFASVLHWRNVCATQFHPEKSQRHGLTLLGNFLGRV